MAQLAKSMPLRWAIENHVTQTRQHISNINRIFVMLEREPIRKTNGAAMGLLSTGHINLVSLSSYSTVRDCLINAEVMQVEQFEIGSNRSLITAARLTGQEEIARIFESHLEDDKEAARIAEESFPILLRKAMLMEKGGLRGLMSRAGL